MESLMIENLAVRETTNDLLLEANLAALRKYQPDIAEEIRKAGEDAEIRVTVSRSGHPVPVMKQKPINSLEDPIQEAEQIARQLLPDPFQQRVIFFGFGFGYHVMPFVRLGFSPIIVEPSAAMLRLAMSKVDFRDVMPYLFFHLGNVIPDIPRSTKVVALPAYAELYPDQIGRLSAKIIVDYPTKTDDIHEGTYYGAYRNVTLLKNPCDLLVYQMLLFLIRPTLIIEIGACRGGSALWFADTLRLMGGDRRVHTYDVVAEGAPDILKDPMITYHLGGHATFDPSIIRKDDRVFIIEDSSHTYENTLEVMHKFAPYVSPNSYFVVEDGVGGLTRPHLNGGPLRAIEEFMLTDTRYEIDQRWEHFYGSKNTNCLKGFLRRKI
ncbi:MAG: hypothetical protein JWO30_2729 [Fibrobacteres bacterium]|nr:hypothetical protein [Fibrobacterota bacterium]